MTIKTKVPCHECVACCCGDAIRLLPEFGDVVEDYETVPHFLPDLARRGVRMLAHNEDRTCYYLTKDGCSIHDRAPHQCQKFDCREFVKGFGKAKALELAENGTVSHAVVKRGIQLLKQARKRQ